MVSNDGGTISGIAEAGSTVTIREGDITLGTVVADSQGNFSLTLTPPKVNGEILTADATDARGQHGTNSLRGVTGYYLAADANYRVCD